MLNATSDSSSIMLRRNIFLTVVALMFIVFTGRLVQLQIIQGSQYRFQADAQGIKKMTIQPVRGALYDRNGYVIVASEGSHSLYITPNKFDKESKEWIAKIMGTDTSEITKLIDRYKINPYTPVRIFRDIDDTTWAKLNEFYYELGGTELENESKRYYSHDVRASHILGYVKEIDQSELEKSNYYVPGDVIGKQGIEKVFETFLRGEKGYEFVAVNNRGQRIESFNDGKSDQSPSNGFDLYLGLDAELQAYAEYLMKQSNYTGAVVAIEPSTGEILALVSAPDYDLDIFNGVTKADEYKKLTDDLDKPLTNRATFGVYPPGSTWKPLMAIAGLEE
ncbi:MAG: penicillin-binding transpeptidase domain-containing protein, partial [Candidatus Kapaibacterium sp.]